MHRAITIAAVTCFLGVGILGCKDHDNGMNDNTTGMQSGGDSSGNNSQNGGPGGPSNSTGMNNGTGPGSNSQNNSGSMSH